MTPSEIQAEIDKLQLEIISLKAEIYDRQEAIKHLEAVRDAMEHGHPEV